MKIGCTIPRKKFKSRKWWILFLLYFNTIFFWLFELRTNFFSHSNHTTSISSFFIWFYILTVYTTLDVIVWRGKYTCVSFVYNSAHAQPHDSIQQQHQQKKRSLRVLGYVLKWYYASSLISSCITIFYPHLIIFIRLILKIKKTGSDECRYVSFKFDLVPAKTLFEYDVSMVLSWPRIKINIFYQSKNIII